MALPIDLWLIHPKSEMCDAFRNRFSHAKTRLTFLLASLAALASCVELNAGSPIDHGTDQNEFEIGKPKLVKTLDSNEKHNVHRGLLDKSGKLWFGTTGEGVNCYDGNLFTQITTNNGLNSNCIFAHRINAIGV